MEDIVITQEMLDSSKLKYEQENKKDLAKKAISSLTIKHNGGEFKANEVAQANMTAVTAVANWQFNKNIEKAFKELALMNPSLEPLANIFTAVYEGVYKSKLKWKTLEGKNSTRQIESIAEVLHKLMLSKGEIITGEKK